MDDQRADESATSRRGPGRPRSIDLRTVAAVSLQLWSQHGFDNVTWAQIADAAGVSERTLLRYFDSKEDPAWVGVPRATQHLKAALEGTPLDVPVAEAIVKAIQESLTVLHDNPSNGPTWLRLISEEPALRASAPTAYRPWVEEIAAFVSRRVPDMPWAACRGIATAYQTTAFETLLQWAQDGVDEDPAAAVSEALSWLDPPRGP